MKVIFKAIGYGHRSWGVERGHFYVIMVLSVREMWVLTPKYQPSFLFPVTYRQLSTT